MYYFNVHEIFWVFCDLMYFYFFSFMRPKNKIRRPAPAPAPIINNNTAEYRYSQQYNNIANNSTQQYPTEPSSNSTGAINDSSPNFHCYPAAVYTMHGSRLFESILMSSLI